MKTLLILAGCAVFISGCGKKKDPNPYGVPSTEKTPAAEQPKKDDPPAVTFNRIEREPFNRVAARLNLPVFWKADTNGNGAVDPDEVVMLRFYDTAPVWTDDGVFTQAFLDAYEAIVNASESEPGGSEGESARMAALWEELDQGKVTLIHNELELTEGEKTFLEHMEKAVDLADKLHARQLGVWGMLEKIPPADAAARRVFTRNWGPACLAPKTAGNPACRVIEGVQKVPVDVYPAELQAQEGFCKTLMAHADKKDLMAPFTVVRQEGGKLVAVPYTKAYEDDMKAMSEELKAAAGALDPEKEAALVAYLNAAAAAFEDNNWEPVDEKWAAMNSGNSRWYVRVGPDETYWEPCNEKAGFHVTFAVINKGVGAWQEKLNPLRQEMENMMAKLAGPPYKAREVNFQMPDFIDIVYNAGDARKNMGAVIGQSLPNWGPVANEGRGRTVVMTNLYTDTDSMSLRAEQAKSLFTKESLNALNEKDVPGLIGIILHEAAHNLGPSHEYQVNGKKDSDVFGGPLATMLEELKAQTAALYYIDLLLKKELLTPEAAKTAYLDNIVWAMGHVSRGMYTESKLPRPYSHVSAIHVGFLMDEGAISWDAEALAANGKDKGAFVLDMEKFPAASEKLMQVSASIKGAGDKAKAEALVARYVDGELIPFAVVAERWLRHPRASFVYSLSVK